MDDLPALTALASVEHAQSALSAEPFDRQVVQQQLQRRRQFQKHQLCLCAGLPFVKHDLNHVLPWAPPRVLHLLRAMFARCKHHVLLIHPA
jgi:hypothetical protein